LPTFFAGTCSTRGIKPWFPNQNLKEFIMAKKKAKKAKAAKKKTAKKKK
jgi:hypothetical protein